MGPTSAVSHQATAFFDVLPIAMAALRFPDTALAVALSAACDAVGASSAQAYLIDPTRVVCLSEAGDDARPILPEGRPVDGQEAAQVRAAVSGGASPRPAGDVATDWRVCSGRPLEGDAYALIICSGLGSGPRIDPAEIRDPLVLLISHRWFSLRTRAMAVELESMKRDRAVVSAMLRHDLRHPIQAITAAAEMVSSAEFELSEEEKVELLDLIVTEANRLNRMLDEAFDDAVGGENVPPKMRWTEVTEVVGKVADTARRRRAGRIEVSVDPQSIRTDPDLLGRALLNLVDNAQKHAPTGTAVQIRGESRGSSYALAVVDAGEGVDPSLVPYLFTPFSNDSERADSTGLGLVSAARVMERLGGRVLYSRVSGTTVFELVLPVDDEATAPGVGSAA